MSLPAASLFDAGGVSGQHCPELEYANYVAGLPVGADTRHRQLIFYRRFVRTYPDLVTWFELPLRDRLGWRPAEVQTRRVAPGVGYDAWIGSVNHNARPYLVYLALTGRLRLDWGWLLGIGGLKAWLVADRLNLPLHHQADQMLARLAALGHTAAEVHYRVSWALSRLVLHCGDARFESITFADVEQMRQAIKHLDRIDGIHQVIAPERIDALISSWGSNAFRAGVALFHAGITEQLPVPYRGLPASAFSHQPRIAAVMERYVDERALTLRPASMSTDRNGLRRFGRWLDAERPAMESLTELRRTDLVEFMTHVNREHKIKQPEQQLAPATRIGIISAIAVFLRFAALAEWDDAPARPLITHADLPRRVQAIPRFIPDHQLDPVMDAIRAMECPLQRCALLVARWSGARRTEIRKLHLDCLDTYADGTPRLRLAAGKALRERTVPLHDEAAQAIWELTATRHGQPDRGLLDTDLGQRVRYLFLRDGVLAPADYLFTKPLGVICTKLDILDDDGKPALHAHRFRHTLGTQLAEKGARTQTIMKILGHKSPAMSMTYAHISDPTVLADYQTVLGPGAVLAGDRAHRNSPGVLIESPHPWGVVNVVVRGCRWWFGGVGWSGRGGRAGGSCRRRG